jgi:hypothetical protein
LPFKRIAEVEIGVAVLTRNTQLQTASWRRRIEEVRAVAAIVLPDQKLS